VVEDDSASQGARLGLFVLDQASTVQPQGVSDILERLLASRLWTPNDFEPSLEILISTVETESQFTWTLYIPG